MKLKELPSDKEKRFVHQYNIKLSDAIIIVKDEKLANFLNQFAKAQDCHI